MIFDELDRSLLRELQTYSLRSNAELAAAIGTTPAVVAERTQTLLAQGVIRGYRAEIDPAAIGRSVQALISVRVRVTMNDAMESFYNWVCDAPEMINVFVASGGSDFVVHVAVPTSGDLYDFLSERVLALPFVLEARTNLIFEHARAWVIDPLDCEETNRHRRRHLVVQGHPA